MAAGDLHDRLGGARSSLAFKAPVRVATTANIVLSGFQTIDGILPTENDANLRILVKNQDDPVQNGIYEMQSGNWRRTKDFDGNSDIVKGTRVYAAGGTAGEGEYKVTAADPILVDTSSITFERSTRDGSDLGFEWLFSSSIIDGDPGDGTLRLNNADATLATALYIDNLDRLGNSVTAWLDSLDDSTSTTKGMLKLLKASDPAVFHSYRVTGSVVDGTGYRKITIAHTGAGSGALSGRLSVTFQPSGDAGAVNSTGAPATGDLATYASTSGTLITPSTVPISALIKTTDIGSTAANGVQAYDPDTLKSDVPKTLTVGYDSTSFSLGTIATGTLTPSSSNGNFQHATNNGGHALAPPVNPTSIVLEYTNSTAPGTITTTAFQIVKGSPSTGVSLKYQGAIIKSATIASLSWLST